MDPSNPEHHHRPIRFLSVVAATLIALACGTNYAYSAWAPQFAERLNLSATQANLIGNAGNIGMYAMGIPSGLLIDSRGPRWGVLLGCVCLSCGYFPLRTAYERGPGGLSVGWLCFFGFLTGVGSCAAFSSAIKVSATNWPRHRGTATAFPLSGFGLSAFLFTTISGFAFPDDTGGLLLLLAVGTFCMVFFGMLFLRMVPANSSYDSLPTEERPGLSRRESNPLHRTKSGYSRHSSKASMDDETEITGWQLARTPAFWHLFILLGLLCGVGLMTINNIGNDAKALWHHYDDSASHDFIQKRQLMHVGIISFCSFLGRLCSGIGSDWLIHHHASRFWTLVVSGTVFSGAQIVGLVLENPNQLFWLSGLTGLGYGCLFGVYPALVADAFGPSGLGINWGAMTMAPVVSGNTYNLFYGTVLDKHSTYKGNPGGGGERVCDEGRNCYGAAYWVTLLSSIGGVGWALWCIRRQKRERLRESREGESREHEG